MNIDEVIAKYLKLANNDKCCQKEEAYQLAEYLTQLKEYRQLEQQGRLIKLPCKVGDTVYLIKNSEKIVERKADMMFIGVLWEEFGKEWFPTRDEAEAKLNELRGI